MKTQRAWPLLGLLLSVFSTSVLALPPYGFTGTLAGPALGMRVADLGFSELDRMGLDYGVRVVDLAAQGPAHAAGLRPGDIVTEFDGKPVYSVARLAWLLNNAPAGTGVRLEYLRAGELSVADVQLFPMGGGAPLAQPTSGAYLGLQPQALTDDLRDAFGVPPGQGVLIATVMEGSPAAEAGLKAGDVIVRMDRRVIHRVFDVHRTLAYFDPGEQLQIEVIRGAKSETVTATLGERLPQTEGAPLWTPGWNDPEVLRRLVPPRDYWKQLMNNAMDSLEQSWSEWYQRPPQTSPESL